MAGPHGVAADAFRRDARPAPALDGVVNPRHNRPAWGKSGDQQAEQDARRGPRAPGRAAQHAVMVHEPPLARQARDAQDARHRALAGHQDGTGQQHGGVAPTALKEQRREGNKGAKARMIAAKRGGRRDMAAFLGGDTPATHQPAPPPNTRQDWPKPS